jgi:hypothetical protein
MKELPDEKTLLEILDLAKDFEQSARELWGASHFCKSIAQSNDTARVLAPFKIANVQKWDAPRKLYSRPI